MTEQQKREFLAELRLSANTIFACEIVGVSRAKAIEAREDDPAFELAWRQAVREAHRSLGARWAARH